MKIMKFATEENIYKCSDCGALQGEKYLHSIKLEGEVILRCHTCNSINLKLHTDLVGMDKCGTCVEMSKGCYIPMFVKKVILKCRFHKTNNEERI